MSNRTSWDSPHLVTRNVQVAENHNSWQSPRNGSVINCEPQRGQNGPKGTLSFPKNTSLWFQTIELQNTSPYAKPLKYSKKNSKRMTSVVTRCTEKSWNVLRISHRQSFHPGCRWPGSHRQVTGVHSSQDCPVRVNSNGNRLHFAHLKAYQLTPSA